MHVGSHGLVGANLKLPYMDLGMTHIGGLEVNQIKNPRISPIYAELPLQCNISISM